MAKSKGKKKQVGKPRPRARKVTSVLDADASAYARLLRDPCGAPLCHPTYAGGEGGYLIRADNWQSFGFSPTMTSGAFQWTPGYMCQTSNELSVMESIAPNVTGTVTGFNGCPGKNFLPDNASVFRCVAACVRVTFPGAEAARAGRVHMGLGNGCLMTVGTLIAPDEFAMTLPHYSRTPASELELRWKPNDADQIFVNPSAALTAAELQRRSSLCVAWAGLPTGVGLVFHMTAIYEWQPKIGVGLGVPSTSRNRSRNTLDQVLTALERAGDKFISGVAELGMGTLTNYITGTYGLMPASMRTRSVRTLGY